MMTPSRLRRAALAACSLMIIALAMLWAYGGTYALHALVKRGATYWLPVGTNSSLISPAMRLALAGAPAAVPGQFEWRTIGPGFEVADLPAVINGAAVDHILLARIDPAKFRFVVRSSRGGYNDLDQWMTQLGPALVVNGSYYGPDGQPATPFLSEGVLLGPKDYSARAGAFVTSASFTAIRDLAQEDWKTAFRGADNAMVSFPLLVADNTNRVTRASRWLANRSFVAQDQAGSIVIGTTTDAFFSLDRLARFLIDSPLKLTIALNLDGGPVACQGISLNGYQRKSYGRWELQVEGDRGQLLGWLYGKPDMPVVLAVYPK
jgi:Phosphodiester glycosidase